MTTRMLAKYDRIGKYYNQTRTADPYIAERLIYHLKPSRAATYLDIGCGTGNYTIALAEAGVRLIAVRSFNRNAEQCQDDARRNPLGNW